MAGASSSHGRLLALFVGLAVIAMAVPAGAAVERSFTDPADTPDGFDVVEVSVSWTPSTSLVVDFTFDNVSDGAFPSGAWVEMAFDVDIDGQAEHLAEVGYAFGGGLRALICDRTGPSSFSCSTQPGVEFLWVNDSTLRIEVGDVPSIDFGERIALRAAAVRDGVWDIASEGGWWLIYESALDTTPPVVEVEYDRVTFWPTSLDGAVIDGFYYPTWALTVTDNLDPQPVLTCEPQPGSFFPIGETTVTCVATDASGNTSEPVSLVVVVYSPSEVLIQAADEVALSEAPGTPGLMAMLVRSADHVDRGRIAAACGTLGAFSAATDHIGEFPAWIQSAVDRVADIADCR